jgi:Icc-related predicted phosphoesterase
MPHLQRHRNIRTTLLVVLQLVAGCAHEAGLRAGLPDELALDGKAIAIIGDLQQTSGIARFVRRRENNAAERERLIADLAGRMDGLAALVIVGDLVFTARSRRHWANFDRLIAPFAEKMPVLPAIGNHDYSCYFVELCRTSVIARGMRDRFPWLVPGQPYAVASEDLLLLFLDSESTLEAQGGWLADELESAAGRYAAALVFFHRPPYTNSVDRGAVGSADVERFFVPALQAAPLPVLAVSGHVHGLEYIVRDGVRYLTTGGGGGPRGPMGEERPFDEYRGRDCPQADGSDFRPLNYVLLRRAESSLKLEIRGFCRGDPDVELLDSIEIAL